MLRQSTAGNNVGDKVNADPPNDTCIDISHLKQHRHYESPGTDINVDHVSHPAVVGIGAAANDGQGSRQHAVKAINAVA